MFFVYIRRKKNDLAGSRNTNKSNKTDDNGDDEDDDDEADEDPRNNPLRYYYQHPHMRPMMRAHPPGVIPPGMIPVGALPPQIAGGYVPQVTAPQPVMPYGVMYQQPAIVTSSTGQQQWVYDNSAYVDPNAAMYDPNTGKYDPNGVAHYDPNQQVMTERPLLATTYAATSTYPQQQQPTYPGNAYTSSPNMSASPSPDMSGMSRGQTVMNRSQTVLNRGQTVRGAGSPLPTTTAGASASYNMDGISGPSNSMNRPPPTYSIAVNQSPFGNDASMTFAMIEAAKGGKH